MDKSNYDNINIRLPSAVTGILNQLNEAGYLSYIVGGCLRDIFLGREPKDYDITTNATPEQVKGLFAEIIPTGEKYGTITVGWTDEQTGEVSYYEVTTFRADGNYSDGRRPDEVTFGQSILDDLSRRDFTINAMAYNHLVGLVDPFDGYEDLRAKIIRCVGNPYDRLNEDALRILRGIRFACKYGFSIDKTTEEAMKQLAYLCLKNVSKERIHDELIKILTTLDNRLDLITTFEKFFKEIFSCVELDAKTLNLAVTTGQGDYVKIIFQLFNYSTRKTNISYNVAALEEWLRMFKFSNADVKQIITLVKLDNFHRVGYVQTDGELRKLYFKYKDTLRVYYQLTTTTKECERIEEIISITPTVINLNGNDIKEILNLEESDFIGKLLEEVTNYALEYPWLNNKDNLLDHLKSLVIGEYAPYGEIYERLKKN